MTYPLPSLIQGRTSESTNVQHFEAESTTLQNTLLTHTKHNIIYFFWCTQFSSRCLGYFNSSFIVCMCVRCVFHPQQQNRSWESQTTQNLLWPQQCMLLYWVFWWQSYKLWKLFGARVEVVEKNTEQYERPSSVKPISFGWISVQEGTWLSPLWRDCVQAFIKIPSSGSRATSRWDLAHWITVHCVWQHTQGCQRVHPGPMIAIPYETVWSRLWMAFSDSLWRLTLSHCLIVFQVNRLSQVLLLWRSCSLSEPLGNVFLHKTHLIRGNLVSAWSWHRRNKGNRSC